jgi:head-tail adaptor
MSLSTLAAGALDQRVNIETRTVTRDAVSGAEIETWTAAASSVWARVWQSSTAAGVDHGVLTAEGTTSTYARPTRVWVRWQSGITRENCRIRHRGELLRIIGVAEVGRQQWLEMSCMEWAHE